MLTCGQAASQLGLSLTAVAKLLDGQFLLDLEASRVLALAAAQHVTTTAGELPVLRTAAPAPTTEWWDHRKLLGDAPS